MQRVALSGQLAPMCLGRLAHYTAAPAVIDRAPPLTVADRIARGEDRFLFESQRDIANPEAD